MKQFYRSSADKRIFGVCGGAAEYFHIDVSLIRIAAVLLAFAGTVGIWIYLVVALIAPVNPDNTLTYDASVRRVTRSRQNKRIAGVCGGIAEYFGWDPVVLRVIFLLTFLLFGAGFFAYLLAWIILPVSDEM